MKENGLQVHLSGVGTENVCFAILAGSLKLMALGGTNKLAAKAVRCLVRQTALLALVSAKGTMPSVRHCFSLSLKY